MEKEKNSQILLNRRAFLSWFPASAGFYFLQNVFGVLLSPALGMAEDGGLSPPGSGGAYGENDILETEFNKRFNALAKESDANAKANNKQLTPEQKKQQSEEEKRVLRSIIESNGYKVISAPQNFRIIRRNRK